MSSKRHKRKRSCESKIQYREETKAIAQAHSLGFPYIAYKCDFCSGWHVGRPNRNIRQRMSARRQLRQKLS